MSDLNVLLVDDDSRLLSSLSRDLSELGYVVTTTVSAIEASAAMHQCVFDAVVCDNHMHGESGVSFLSSLKHRYPNVAKILLSGGLDQKKKEEVEMRGFAHFVLNKPCDVSKLDQRIQEAIVLAGESNEEAVSGVVSSTVKKFATYFRNNSGQ